MENQESESETESGNHPPLKIEPENIYFGSLSPGKGGNIELKVTGGPAHVTINNDRLKVTPSDFGVEGAGIQVELLPGSAGELIWDNILVKGQTDEISVLVTARWEGLPTLDAAVGKSVVTPAVEVSGARTVIEIQDVPKPRPLVGRRCERCHKNFAYDSNTHDWEQCNCNWYQAAVNISLRIINELKYGIKDFPSFAKETWNVILGKEKW